MTVRVPPEGSLDAKLVLIGEAPGWKETQLKRPFVGPSGTKLTEWCQLVGLKRSQFYITNVYKYQAPGSKIAKAPKAEVLQASSDLHTELASLTDPWLIIPTGNIALRSLFRRGLFDPKSPTIGDWRGSITSYKDLNGRTIKVIPTIHPAALFESPYLEGRCRHDWARIASEAGSRWQDTHTPITRVNTSPSPEDLDELYRNLNDAATLTIDIETDPSSNTILCVGFATNPYHATVISTVGTSPLGFGTRVDWIQRLCSHPVPKVMQKGLYDTYWLKRKWNIEVVNWVWDTLCMHHALDPCDDHDLGYLASIYTRRPFWKREAKDTEARRKYASDLEATLTYCGMDCGGESEIYEVLHDHLHQQGLIDFYHQHYSCLFRPLLHTMCHGVRVDTVSRRRKYVELLARCIRLQDNLQSIAGKPLHAKVDLATPRVQRYLYETLGLPKQHKGRTKSVTSDETALRKLRLVVTDPLHIEVIDSIMEHRKKYKQLGYLTDDKVDSDGRLRCEYKVTTEAARLASSENPMGTGMNLQNIDRKLKGMFLPDM